MDVWDQPEDMSESEDDEHGLFCADWAAMPATMAPSPPTANGAQEKVSRDNAPMEPPTAQQRPSGECTDDQRMAVRHQSSICRRSEPCLADVPPLLSQPACVSR